jgi:hypothetical protein
MEKIDEATRLDGIFSTEHQAALLSLTIELRKFFDTIDKKLDLPGDLQLSLMNQVGDMQDNVGQYIDKKRKEMSQESIGEQELADLKQALGKFK